MRRVATSIGAGRPQRARALRQQAVAQARVARRYLLILVPVLSALLVINGFRRPLFGTDVPVRIGVAIALLATGWALASQLGRYLQPKLMSRLEPGTAGIVSFMIRLVAIGSILIVALRIAGLRPGTLALGASFTAVVLGLAAQQTIGNIFAGIVLLSARPFTIGDRVRFAGFGMDVEGTVTAHGLLYVTCHDGQDPVLVPNNTALTMSVRPIRRPAAVDLRARLPRSTDPETVQQGVCDALSVAVEETPHIALEEYHPDEVVMRIRAAPADPRQGGALAREVLAAVDALAGRHAA